MRPIAALALLALTSLAVATTAATTPVASIRVATSKPFVVKGMHFKRSETVRVALTFKGVHTRIVKASTQGGFTARFLRINVRTCDGYIVRATGNKGSHAFVRRTSDCIGG